MPRLRIFDIAAMPQLSSFASLAVPPSASIISFALVFMPIMIFTLVYYVKRSIVPFLELIIILNGIIKALTGTFL